MTVALHCRGFPDWFSQLDFSVERYSKPLKASV